MGYQGAVILVALASVVEARELRFCHLVDIKSDWFNSSTQAFFQGLAEPFVVLTLAVPSVFANTQLEFLPEFNEYETQKMSD